MRVVLIGAGNVATHFGEALLAAGYHILQVYSRTEQSAGELASRLNATFCSSSVSSKVFEPIRAAA